MRLDRAALRSGGSLPPAGPSGGDRPSRAGTIDTNLISRVVTYQRLNCEERLTTHHTWKRLPAAVYAGRPRRAPNRAWAPSTELISRVVTYQRLKREETLTTHH